MSVEYYWAAVAAVAIMSGARLSRLLTFDSFPPIKWVRDKYEDATDGSDWQMLTMCGYCISFWLVGALVGWAWLVGVLDGVPTAAMSDAEQLWWIVNGALGGSYLSAIVMKFDGDDAGRA